MIRPDYTGNGIVNLMASLETDLGDTSSYARLNALEAMPIASSKTVILFVIDGLGFNFLQRELPEGFLARHATAPITSVFPATTAAAITTFLTGTAPQQHAHTGWHTWFEELQQVVAGLPFVTRGKGKALPARKLAGLFGGSAIFERLRRSSFVVAPQDIAFSSFNACFSKGAQIVPYASGRDLFDRLGDLCRAPDPKYVYAYWPELDRLGHLYGMNADPPRAHLRMLDQALANFAARNVGNGVLLLVTADHGFVDCAAEDNVFLDTCPQISATLSQPLCGEPRAAWCYVRTAQGEVFERSVDAELAGLFDAVPSRQLIDAGYFGEGEPDDRLHARVGDYTLLPREQVCIRDTVKGETPLVQLGVHGGLSEDEQLVPLTVIDA